MAAKRVEYHEGAAEDVRQSLAWYEERSPRAALDFIDELNRAAVIIAKDPGRWPMGKNQARHFVLWRFPFKIIYSEEAFRIVIWAVAHASRHPDYWASRKV